MQNSPAGSPGAAACTPRTKMQGTTSKTDKEKVTPCALSFPARSTSLAKQRWNSKAPGRKDKAKTSCSASPAGVTVAAAPGQNPRPPTRPGTPRRTSVHWARLLLQLFVSSWQHSGERQRSLLCLGKKLHWERKGSCVSSCTAPQAWLLQDDEIHAAQAS